MKKEAKSIFVSLIIILAGYTEAYAQHRITGRIVDAQGKEPEIGAVVQVFADEAIPQNLEAYAISDSLGNFTVELRRPREAANHLLHISNLGRKTVTMPIAPDSPLLDLGTIEIEDDAQTLSSAKVSAARPLIKMDADKISYDVQSDVDSKASTVLDMLRKVPMVTVDGQDNITVNGSSSFKVYVDGKPNQMLSSNPSQIFKSMPASAVQEIEVITNPGAKYDAEGTGGVLNLITARGAGSQSAVPDGANGSLTAGVNSQGSLQGGVYLNAKKGRLTVGANLNSGMQNRKGMTYENTQESSDGLTIKSSSDNLSQNAHVVFGDFNASYELDTLNLFSASIGLQHWQFRQFGPTSLLATYGGASLFGYDGEGTSGGHQTGLNTSMDWQHSFAGNREKTFTLSYRFAREPEYEDNESHFSNIFGTTVYDRRTDGRDFSAEHTVQADFTTPLAKGQSLSTGAKYIYRHNNSDDKFYLDKGAGFVLEDSDDNYHHFNNIAAAYAEYSGAFGNFSLKGGLRYEYTWQTINYTDGRTFSSNYGNLVPNLTLQYNLSQTQNLGLTYNLRIRRPGISYLCPFIDRAGTTSISYGNPDILPEKTHSAMLKYNFFSPKFMGNFSLAYKYGDGGISAYSFYGPDPDDASAMILQNTYGNIVRTNTLGFNWFLNWNPVKDTRVYSSMDAGYSDFYSSMLGQRNSGFTGFAMVGAQQTIPWDLRLSLNIFGSLRRHNIQGWNSGFSGVSLAISKPFLNEKLNVSLRGFSNLGKGDARFEGYSKGLGFESRSVTTVPLSNIGLEISWKFGQNSFQVKKAKHTINNDDVMNAEHDDAASQANQMQ